MKEVDFEPLDGGAAPAAPVSGAGLDRLRHVPVELTVQIGSASMTIGETLALAPGSIVPLNRSSGEPVDVLLNGRPIGRGEVVVIDDEFGVRVTEVNPAA